MSSYKYNVKIQLHQDQWNILTDCAVIENLRGKTFWSNITYEFLSKEGDEECHYVGPVKVVFWSKWLYTHEGLNLYVNLPSGLYNEDDCGTMCNITEFKIID